jgi:hypothetical protein
MIANAEESNERCSTFKSWFMNAPPQASFVSPKTASQWRTLSPRLA